MSIKAIHQEALGFYMYHNISKHIKHFSSVFHNFSLMFCVLCWIFENHCPGGEGLARFFYLCVALPLCPRGGEFALSKSSPGVFPGGGHGQAWN